MEAAAVKAAYLPAFLRASFLDIFLADESFVVVFKIFKYIRFIEMVRVVAEMCSHYQTPIVILVASCLS